MGGRRDGKGVVRGLCAFGRERGATGLDFAAKRAHARAHTHTHTHARIHTHPFTPPPPPHTHTPSQGPPGHQLALPLLVLVAQQLDYTAIAAQSKHLKVGAREEFLSGLCVRGRRWGCRGRAAAGRVQGGAYRRRFVGLLRVHVCVVCVPVSRV